MSKVQLLVLSLGLSLSVLSCTNPSEPESFQDRMLLGERFWFVSADHYYLQSVIRIDTYAYVTLLSAEANPRVTFVSSVGDTEVVALHSVNPGHGVAYDEEVSWGGAIYLRMGSESPPNDGHFCAGVNESTIEAFYYSAGAQSPLRITAVVRP